MSYIQADFQRDASSTGDNLVSITNHLEITRRI